MNAAWPCPMDADLKSSELTSRGEFGLLTTGRTLLDSRSADNMVASGSPAGSSVVGEGPMGFILPSSDKVVRSRSKAMVGTIVDP